MIQFILEFIRIHFVSKLSNKLKNISSNNFSTQKNRNLKWLSHFWKGSDNTSKINVSKKSVVIFTYTYVFHSVDNQYSEWLILNNYPNKHLLLLTIINVSIPGPSGFEDFQGIFALYLFIAELCSISSQHKVKRAELKCSNIKLTSLNKWTTKYFPMWYLIYLISDLSDF